MTPALPDEERDEPVEDIRRDEEAAAREADLHYGNVSEFVADRFIYLVPPPAPGSGLVWCPEWFRHAQALSRLDAIWRAWESLRFDNALGMSNWWTYHVDPHMRALMDPVTGPFWRCANGHQDPGALPIEKFPEGLLDDQRNTWMLSGQPFALD